jgi:type IV pilus assembly protein PilA
MFKKDQKAFTYAPSSAGFTLIELLIVIAIIAIIAAVVFVALNPLKRFQESRDARRWSDVNAILHAIKVDQVDNGGTYLPAISSLTSGSVYMIVDGNGSTAMTAGCDDNNTYCDTNVTGDTTCVDLDGLVTEGYLGDIPISPAGNVAWDDGDTAGEEGTGYTLSYNSTTGIVTVRACESEDTSGDVIEVAR